VVVLLLPLLLLARSLLFHLPGVSSVQLRWRRQGARKKAKKEGQNGRYSHDKNFLEKISAHPYPPHSAAHFYPAATLLSPAAALPPRRICVAVCCRAPFVVLRPVWRCRLAAKWGQ